VGRAAIPPAPAPLTSHARSPAGAWRGGRADHGDQPARLPDLAFEDADGKPRKLSEWRGKTVLVNLWATGAALRKEMPALESLQTRLAFSGSFRFSGRGSMLIAITSKILPPNLVCRLSSAGISLRQGTHQVPTD